MSGRTGPRQETDGPDIICTSAPGRTDDPHLAQAQGNSAAAALVRAHWCANSSLM